MTIEQPNFEEQLFVRLRLATVQRLRATSRGDSGLGVLLARERAACLAELGLRETYIRDRILHAA